MKAKQIILGLNEAGPDPDDPNIFIKHFKDAWTRAGFEATATETGEEKWIWREGPFSVEVVHHAQGGVWAMRGATSYEIYAFIKFPGAEDDPRQSAYARKDTTTEEKALAAAVKLKAEISNSMAARLTKLGFTGWRNHWHRSPISVSLKKGYSNISVKMDYVPNEQAIALLTKLTRMTGKF